MQNSTWRLGKVSSNATSDLRCPNRFGNWKQFLRSERCQCCYAYARLPWSWGCPAAVSPDADCQVMTLAFAVQPASTMIWLRLSWDCHPQVSVLTWSWKCSNSKYRYPFCLVYEAATCHFSAWQRVLLITFARSAMRKELSDAAGNLLETVRVQN